MEKNMQRSIWKAIAIATLVCGTLDILLAVFLTLLRGKEPAAMLRSVASGPFPAATEWGAAGSLLGLAVHYGLMTIMVVILILLIVRWPQLLDTPWRTALAYGVLTYFIMNWAVVPLRFHTPLPPQLLPFATQMFAHVVLVGIPATFIARRFMRG
jgi:hypothetical protein